MTPNRLGVRGLYAELGNFAKYYYFPAFKTKFFIRFSKITPLKIFCGFWDTSFFHKGDIVANKVD